MQRPIARAWFNTNKSARSAIYRRRNEASVWKGNAGALWGPQARPWLPYRQSMDKSSYPAVCRNRQEVSVRMPGPTHAINEDEIIHPATCWTQKEAFMQESRPKPQWGSKVSAFLHQRQRQTLGKVLSSKAGSHARARGPSTTSSGITLQILKCTGLQWKLQRKGQGLRTSEVPRPKHVFIRSRISSTTNSKSLDLRGPQAQSQDPCQRRSLRWASCSPFNNDSVKVCQYQGCVQLKAVQDIKK